MQTSTPTFKEAYELKIGSLVEKKGKFSYLSWPHAVKHLRENYPDATWIVHENPQGLPFFEVNAGAMVKVSIVLNDKTYTQWLPVLNYQNKPITEPNSFEINTSIMRCLAKAVGIATGIGLGLYSGEDLPVEEKEDVDYWEKQADHHDKTVEMLGTWYKDNVEDFKNHLSTAQVKQVNTYVSNLKDAVAEAAKEEA